MRKIDVGRGQDRHLSSLLLGIPSVDLLIQVDGLKRVNKDLRETIVAFGRRNWKLEKEVSDLKLKWDVSKRDNSSLNEQWHELYHTNRALENTVSDLKYKIEQYEKEKKRFEPVKTEVEFKEGFTYINGMPNVDLLDMRTMYPNMFTPEKVLETTFNMYELQVKVLKERILELENREQKSSSKEFLNSKYGKGVLK